MTFPFYFRPIKIDGRLLFDGGLYNNFPADVMYDEFFPDIIIGSRVSRDFSNIREDDLTSQMESMLTSATNYEIPCDNGVIIRPPVKDVNVIDFRNTQAFIESGYEAAKQKIPEIRSFVYDTVSGDALKQKRQDFNSRKPELIVDRIYVEGLNDIQTKYVNRLLRLGEDQVPIEKIKREYFKLVADDKINHIFPQLKYNENTGLFDMCLEVKRENDILVEFGGSISSSPINSAFIGARYNFLGLHALTASVNSYIGRFYTSAQASARLDLSTVLPVFIEPMLTFNQWDYFKSGTYFFEDKTPSYLQKREFTWALNAGIPVLDKSKMVWGFSSFMLKDEYYQTNFFTRVDTADVTRFRGFSPYVAYELNTLNHKQYANRGRFFRTSLRLISGEETHTPGSTSLRRAEVNREHFWWQLKMKYEHYFEVLDHFRIGLYNELVLSNPKMFNNYTSTLLHAPAFYPVPESKTLFSPAYRAHSYAAAGLRNVFVLHKNFDLRFEAYAFSPHRTILQDGNFQAFYGQPFSVINYAGSAAMVFHSPIGPLSLTLNYFNKNEDPFSVIFNLGFIIFNPSPLE
jgi:NTE family protein